jgi:hypothetical protein
VGAVAGEDGKDGADGVADMAVGGPRAGL